MVFQSVQGGLVAGSEPSWRPAFMPIWRSRAVSVEFSESSRAGQPTPARLKVDFVPVLCLV